MLTLSEVLLQHGHNFTTFQELSEYISKTAVTSGEMYFTIDIEPPAYHDRPQNWYEQLELTFSSAR